MTKFESAEKHIKASRNNVYDFVSDINNFNTLVPEGKVRNFETENDRCSFRVDGLGQVGVRVVSREPYKYVKFESEGSVPFRFNMWIDLEDADDSTTIMKLTMKADLNMMMKMVAQKPMEEGLEVIASQLSDHLNRRQWA